MTPKEQQPTTTADTDPPPKPITPHRLNQDRPQQQQQLLPHKYPLSSPFITPRSKNPESGILTHHLTSESNYDEQFLSEPLVPTTTEEDNTRIEYNSQLSFFSTQIQNDFGDLLDSIHTNLINLNITHESLINFNESFSSLLFGLDINAWCINFDESPNLKTWVEFEKLNQVQAEIDDYLKKIKELEAELSESNKMPPPPTTKPMARSTVITRGNINGSDKGVVKSYLRAGSTRDRRATRQSSIPTMRGSSRGGSKLNLSSARKSTTNTRNTSNGSEGKVRGNIVPVLKSNLMSFDEDDNDNSKNSNSYSTNVGLNPRLRSSSGSGTNNTGGVRNVSKGRKLGDADSWAVKDRPPFR